MNKLEFINELKNKLSGLPQEDIDRSIDYYGEIIDDRVEDGLTEEEAIEAIGSTDEVVSQILIDTPLPKLVKAKLKQNKALKVWEVVLLVLGSPLWLSLIAVAVCVILSVYIVIWAVIAALYAVVASLAVGGIAGLAGFFVTAFSGDFLHGLLMLGAGLICAGAAILLFFGFNVITKAILKLSKALLFSIKKSFVKERAE